MKKQPLINEIVATLDRLNRPVLDRFRQENPTFKDILKLGLTLGPEDGNASELIVRAKLAILTLETMLSRCDTELPKLKKRIKHNHALLLLGQISGAISGATILVVLALDYKFVSYLCGTLSLFAAIIPLVVEWRRKSLYNNRPLEDPYAEMIGLRIEANLRLNDIKALLEAGNNTRLADKINECNQLCANLMKMLTLSTILAS